MVCVYSQSAISATESRLRGKKMKYGGGRGKERDREGERICERERKDAH